MSGHKQRNTLYAIISALEVDLREFIETLLLPTPAAETLFSEELRTKAHRRWQQTVNDPEQEEPTTSNLIPFFDLGDVLQCIQRGGQHLPEAVRQNFGQHRKKIEELIPVRNRVMHSRPLEFDDYYTVINLARALTASLTSEWRQLRATLKEIQQNPDFVDSIKIPTDLDNPETAYHNLPAPDFDDTGFLGRHKELENLKKALSGPYPVVTLLGEGGVGKSALALKAAYDFLDDPNSSFDAIVWTTAKANKLTTHEIIAIDDAIRTSMGIFDSAANILGRNVDSDPVTDLHLSLRNNRILLIIDNLETIIDENIRTFVNDIQGSSKVLFTTRIGLGAYDFPIPIGPFSSKEARHFLRRTCAVWSVNDVAKFSDQKLDEYCKRLQFNPLFIKWFVQGIQSGQRPDAILANPKVLLQFCLQNVFDHLSEDAKLIANALLTLRSAQTQSALVFITHLPTQRFQSALSSLISANIVSPQRAANAEDDDSYYMSQLATLYLANYRAPAPDLQAHFLRQRNILRTELDTIERRSGTSIYSWHSIQPRTPDDYYVCRLLADAIRALLGDPAEAIKFADAAYNLSPNFFEVRRVRALIFQEQGNYVQAETEFEAAISLHPKHAPLRLWYAGFLMRRKQEFDRAVEELEIACQLDPTAFTPRLELARVLLFSKRFEEAREALAQTNNISAAPIKVQRQRVDLLIQTELRHSVELVETQRYADALAQTIAAERIFSEAEYGQVDDYTCEHAVKALRKILPGLHRNFARTPQEQDLVKLDDWFSAIRKRLNISDDRSVSATGSTEVYEGFVMSILRDASGSRTFGFIQRDNGPNLFYHKNHFIDEDDFSKLAVGTKVSFMIGTNRQGPCAIEVSIIR